MSQQQQNNTRAKPSLEQLLRRGDVWRGHSRAFISRDVVSSGLAHCDKALLNNGWPTGSLIELCLGQQQQKSSPHAPGVASQGEWQLFTPVIKTVCQQQDDNYVILLNPPALPFAPALIQEDIPLNQLLVVKTRKKQDFIASFTELTRSPHCGVLLAWQPKQALSYTELRKCQLSCSEGSGLYFLLRSPQAKNQSSPASLRLDLSLGDACLEVEIFKQRGVFQRRAFSIHLPEHWVNEAGERTLFPFPLVDKTPR